MKARENHDDLLKGSEAIMTEDNFMEYACKQGYMEGICEMMPYVRLK